MKKLILPLFTLMLTASIICHAATIDVNSAKTVASNFYRSNSDKNITSITIAFTETTSDGSPAYYVFNINSNDGFVIVTADDAALPVIGYATTGHFDSGKVVPPLVMWLERRKKEISYIKSQNLPATQNIKNQWQKYQTPQNKNIAHILGAGVGPLCTTTWNQTDPYNNLCPNGSVTGCVATAMAQIMKYWNYPSHGIGSVTYDDITSKGFSQNEGKLSANFGNTTYDWSAMPDALSGSSTVVQINAVATLMYDCGVSIYMDYNPSGSSANMIPYDSLGWRDPYGGKVCSQAAYSQYFGYDSTTMKGVQKNDFSQTAWDSLLENELNHNRPIQYGGYTDASKAEGHSWVLDGYDVNNNFHMNWGWGGDFNGYFNIESLSVSFYQLNSFDEALIGIQPRSFVGIEENSLENYISIYPNPATNILNIELKNTFYKQYFYSANLKIYNLEGKKELEKQITKPIEQIEITNLPQGLYFLKIQTLTSIYTTKFIKD